MMQSFLQQLELFVDDNIIRFSAAIFPISKKVLFSSTEEVTVNPFFIMIMTNIKIKLSNEHPYSTFIVIVINF